MLRKLLIAGLLGSVALAAAVELAAARTPGVKPRAAAPATSMCGALTTAPTYKHVVIIMEENEPYNSIIGSSSAPYINSVIKACGLATAYHNITHNSLPNYIGITTGATLSQLQPYLNDCLPSSSCEWTGNNLFAQVSPKGWKGYAESMPTPCDKADAGFYAPKHNPAVYDTDLAACKQRDVPLGTTSSSALLNDFSSEATAPAFAMVTPNLCDDMHGATGCPSNEILAGDNWLGQWLPLITGTNVYKANDTAIFIVWDEGEGGSKSVGENCANNTTDQSCHVAAIVVAPSVKAGTKVSAQLNHYSVQKAVEQLLGFPQLGLAKTATSLVAPFNL